MRVWPYKRVIKSNHTQSLIWGGYPRATYSSKKLQNSVTTTLLSGPGAMADLCCEDGGAVLSVASELEDSISPVFGSQSARSGGVV